MYSEEEAKKKWCPFSRDVCFDGNVDVGGLAAGSFNRPFGGGFIASQSCNCIASECMCWQWETIRMQDPDIPIPTDKTQTTGRGYCGLTRVR